MPRHDLPLPQPTPEQEARIRSLGHRVQSAVAFFEGRQEAFGERCMETEPKHLRVGVNSALVETSALARLMFRKKLITSEEYFDALIESWEAEVALYQARVAQINPRFTV
jgi:hypothetical protein